MKTVIPKISRAKLKTYDLDTIREGFARNWSYIVIGPEGILNEQIIPQETCNSQNKSIHQNQKNNWQKEGF